MRSSKFPAPSPQPSPQGERGPVFAPLPPDTRRAKGSFVKAAGSFVPKIAAKAFEKYGFHTAEIMTDWARIAGADVAKYTEPERLRWPRANGSGDTEDTREARPGGTLVLRVDPARALEIEYKGAEIIDRINRYFGYRAVDTLKLIQAPLTKAATVPTAVAPVAAVPPAPPLSAANASLSAALSNLWTSIHRTPPKR